MARVRSKPGRGLKGGPLPTPAIAPHGSPRPKKTPGRARRPFSFGVHRLGFVHSANAALNILRATVLRLGLALVGGDFTGNARGSYAIDLQGLRSDPVQVASGYESLCFGNEDTASGIGSVAVGVGCTASGLNSFAFGTSAYALAAHAMAFGTTALAN